VEENLECGCRAQPDVEDWLPLEDLSNCVFGRSGFERPANFDPCGSDEVVEIWEMYEFGSIIITKDFNAFWVEWEGVGFQHTFWRFQSVGKCIHITLNHYYCSIDSCCKRNPLRSNLGPLVTRSIEYLYFQNWFRRKKSFACSIQIFQISKSIFEKKYTFSEF